MFLINRYAGGGGGGGGFGGFGGGGGGGGGMFGGMMSSLFEAAANYKPDPPMDTAFIDLRVMLLPTRRSITLRSMKAVSVYELREMDFTPARSHPSVIQANENDEDRQFRRVFNQLAGEDMEVSATELMGILNKIVAKHGDLKTDGFSQDSCRSMVAVMDSDSTGKLGFEEFKYLWNNIKKWQAVYKRYDTDRSGTIGAAELPGAFQAAGFQLSGELFQMIIRRYSDEKGEMDFDNFICCLVRLDAMFRAFKALDKDGDGRIKVTIQEWLQLTMYS